MTIKFVQRNCKEGNVLDLRQSKAIQKYKPDIVFIEAPTNENSTGYIFNKYVPSKKPKGDLNVLKKDILSASKITPWVKSDLFLWKNIETLWSQGKNTLVYKIDGPRKLVHTHFIPAEAGKINYKDWIWWVRIYLREKYMSQNISHVLNKRFLKNKIIVLVCVQSFHWNHVRFLMSKPKKSDIWKLYFGRFKKLTPQMIKNELRKQNLILYYYWLKKSDFVHTAN